MFDRPLHVVVEIPKGSRNKYEWDPRLRAFKLDRLLFSSVAYPGDYGFVPDTLAPDGDPLDAIVCVSEATFPGCVIPVRPVGLLRMHDEKGRDDKLLCVPPEDPNWREVERLEQVPAQLRGEIEHFFSIYKQPEGKHVEVEGWRGLDAALEALADARRVSPSPAAAGAGTGGA